MSSVINDNNDLGYYVTPTGISISGRIKQYANIAERDADTNNPNYAVVLDATADPTVKVGSAMYVRKNNSWVKVHETESMDLDDKFKWNTLIGRPVSTAEEIDASVQQSHTHNNKPVIDRLSVDVNNELAFDGITITNNTSVNIGPAVAANTNRIETLEQTVSIHDTQIKTLIDNSTPLVYVTSINGKTGVVNLTIDELGGASSTSVNLNTDNINKILGSLTWEIEEGL